MNQTYNFHFVLVFKTSDKVRKETLILRFFLAILLVIISISLIFKI
ncbi:Uncharacterised protein [Mycobacteroides abscessus subsp. abscessus]|nr:Uncharacterised protein [Mycobacteroides abscessus subsp. abscessus]